MNSSAGASIPRPSARRAVIDVGTNSVKLLVADVSADGVEPVLETARQTRLGRGFYPSHVLQSGPIADTVRAVKDFAQAAQSHGATGVRVFATSAAREARNADVLALAVRDNAGLELEIISGDREARWAFEGVTSDPRLHTAPILLLDVGGGSTEFILGRQHDVRFRHSYPVGAVRLLERLNIAEPPDAGACKEGGAWLRDFLVRELAPPCAEARRAWPDAPLQLVGTGGTASILGAMALKLARFDRDHLDGHTLSRCEVEERLDQLWSLPLEQRRAIPGLPPERADVILTGVLIYAAALRHLGFDALRISTRGLRYAAVAETDEAT